MVSEEEMIPVSTVLVLAALGVLLVTLWRLGHHVKHSHGWGELRQAEKEREEMIKMLGR